MSDEQFCVKCGEKEAHHIHHSIGQELRGYGSHAFLEEEIDYKAELAQARQQLEELKRERDKLLGKYTESRNIESIPLVCAFCGKHVPMAFQQCQSCKESAEQQLAEARAQGMRTQIVKRLNGLSDYQVYALVLGDYEITRGDYQHCKGEALRFAAAIEKALEPK